MGAFTNVNNYTISPHTVPLRTAKRMCDVLFTCLDIGYVMTSSR